ncbi:DNA-directed DNA polymerase [Methanococcus vannielii SB]|uniref:DNA polymerase II small subunit n=1 Tax=Methanococcus vannielii (strain ATCC 35089 / DSM 1224 / JCM 13029 / OCM 148 / SB) TaxID=406327 RepID=A6URI8_METVS|nr:DNA-directed DNA polymerase II small subunit [Methanococcus vannielii]ABR55110.1 DNA-directed DNA polymerase [Methanococcus vannielii SB]
MITKFLDIEIILSPESYERMNELDKNDFSELFNKVVEFKKKKDEFLLLDSHFLDIFLGNNLKYILETYGNFDFLAYYTSGDFLKLENNTKFDTNDYEVNNIENNNLGASKKENVKTEMVIYDRDFDSELEVLTVPINENLLKLQEERKKRIFEIKRLKEGINTRIKYIAKDIEPQIHIYDEYDVTGKSTCEGSLDDFVKYFKDRFNTIKKIIESKLQKKAYPLNQLSRRKKETGVFIAGIVSDINSTKNGHKIVEIEDENTTFRVLLMKDKIDKGDVPNDILLDEVIAFEGTLNDKGDVMFVDKAFRPDITPKNPPKSSEEKLFTAFLSDVHIGSHEFMAKTFGKFIKFLNGDVSSGLEEKIVSRLKYISIAGDLVDGVGIYPGQEYDLYDVDIISQYKEFAAYLEQIPEHIKIIVSPGNHDALRPAEPQPAFDESITDLFPKENINFIGNPGLVNIHGLDLLLYHGRSFDDVIGQISSAQYTDPPSIMRELLKRRHLCPTYGGRCPIAPEHIDYLAIHKEPDIFHTGHIHINGYGNYRGVTMVNSGTFQEQTDFQKKMGIRPTPGIVPILDLSKTKDHVIEWNNGKIVVVNQY